MKKLMGALVLLVIAWIIWPYYAVYDLVTAVQNGDQEALDRRIDWQPLRQGLRDDLNAMFMKKLASDQQSRSDRGGALGVGLAALMGPAIIDRAIDAYVTPAGIAALIKSGGRPAQAEEGGNSTVAKDAGTPGATTTAVPVSPSSSPRFSFDRVRYAFFSNGPMTFRLEVAPPEGSQTHDNAVLQFRWDGDWRLNRIFLPKDITQ